LANVATPSQSIDKSFLKGVTIAVDSRPNGAGVVMG